MRTAIYILIGMAVSGWAMAGNHGAGHGTGHGAGQGGGHSTGNTVSVATGGTANTTNTLNTLTRANSTMGTVNTAGDPTRPPGISVPVNQPTIPPPSATTTSPPGVTPLPPQFNRHDQMTDRQAQMTDQRMINPGRPRANDAANFQQRIPPASRGVGTPGKPDCSRMRGIDKADCERRDTVRDDLPAGVTTTQPLR